MMRKHENDFNELTMATNGSCLVIVVLSLPPISGGLGHAKLTTCVRRLNSRRRRFFILRPFSRVYIV